MELFQDVGMIQHPKYQHDIPHLKDKNHDFLSRCREKAFDKIQHSFLIKIFQQSGYRGNLLQHNKSYI